jgi:stage IV sporulation protein B
MTKRSNTVFRTIIPLFTLGFLLVNSPSFVEANKMEQTSLSSTNLNKDSEKILSTTKMGNSSHYQVIPSGQSIGIKLHTRGAIVVGHHLIRNKETDTSPGKQAGIEVGDLIQEANQITISNLSDLTEIIQKAGIEQKPINFVVERNKKRIHLKVSPTLDEEGKRYQIGLYIRDSAAGIGTMTYFDPKNNQYGALGHVISDMETKKPLPIKEGEILSSSITSIVRGAVGRPGEKNPSTDHNETIIGDVKQNTSFGIFGKTNEDYTPNARKEMTVARPNEVKEGKAQILTVIHGNKIQPFDIQIIQTSRQDEPTTKSMILQITDPTLLKKTGGIVQGMSGSPIIQDGKIVGAVTHVFVNDPTKGYGVYLQWMLEESKKINSKNNEKQAA